MPALAARPPRPRLAFRVGVTGHSPGDPNDPVRNHVDPACEPAIRERIREVLAWIEHAVGEAHTQAEGAYDDTVLDARGSRPARAYVLRVISPLAEGADRWVADEGRRLGYEIQVPIPFLESRYEEDFKTEDSLREYQTLRKAATSALVLDADPSDPARYVAVGRTVRSNCDLLIAIWNGRDAKGEGGTAQVVREARQNQLPVLHIHAAAPHAAVLLGAPDVETTPAVTRELMHAEILRLLLPVDAAQLRRAENEHKTLVMRACAPPLSDATIAHPPHEGQVDREGVRRRTYFAEPRLSGTTGRPFQAVLKLFIWLATEWWFRARPRVLASMRWRPATVRPDYERTLEANWTQDWSRPDEPAPEEARELIAAVGPHCAWADNLATYYAGKHRGVFTWSYILAPFAVLVAAGGYLASKKAFWSTAEPCVALPGATCAGVGLVATVVEIAILVAILYLLRRERRNNYHDKWLDYRALAEKLRHLTILLPLGRTSPAVRVASHVAEGDPRTSWIDWVVRAVIREAGLFRGDMNAGVPPALVGSADAPTRSTYLRFCRRVLLDGELCGQARYHLRVSSRLHTVAHSLHQWTGRLFWAALIAAGVHLLVDAREAKLVHDRPRVVAAGNHAAVEALDHETHLLHGLGGLLTLLAVVLPAFGGAAHGFLSQGDFQNTSRRSKGLATKLQSYLADLGGPLPLTSTRLGDIAEDAAREMTEELVGWRVETKAKPAGYP
jgi:hypothetical protein